MKSASADGSGLCCSFTWRGLMSGAQGSRWQWCQGSPLQFASSGRSCASSPRRPRQHRQPLLHALRWCTVLHKGWGSCSMCQPCTLPVGAAEAPAVCVQGPHTEASHRGFTEGLHTEASGLCVLC